MHRYNFSSSMPLRHASDATLPLEYSKQRDRIAAVPLLIGNLPDQRFLL